MRTALRLRFAKRGGGGPSMAFELSFPDMLPQTSGHES